MTNFINKVKEAYQNHKVIIVFGVLFFLGITISFALGLIVGEELVSKTPFIYSKTELK